MKQEPRKEHQLSNINTDRAYRVKVQGHQHRFKRNLGKFVVTWEVPEYKPQITICKFGHGP